jgi:hypothetical protein
MRETGETGSGEKRKSDKGKGKRIMNTETTVSLKVSETQKRTWRYMILLEMQVLFRDCPGKVEFNKSSSVADNPDSNSDPGPWFWTKNLKKYS